jgi:ribosome recycling factor
MSEGTDLKELKRRMDGAIAAFKSDIASLRTGRASANILDPVTVEAYGSRMPLNQVANITVPEPRMLTVSVWDKSMVGAVERSIRESNLGLNPIVAERDYCEWPARVVCGGLAYVNCERVPVVAFKCGRLRLTPSSATNGR